MSQVLIAFSNWLHSVAAVIMIGHYLLLSLIYLPALQGTPSEIAGPLLSEISKRSRLWLYAALLVFLLTGLALMIASPDYLGIGKFGNPWSVLMLIKHVLVLGMLGLGFWFNAILRVGPLMSSNHGAQAAILRFRTYSNYMAALGVCVLLLTAWAQAA